MFCLFCVSNHFFLHFSRLPLWRTNIPLPPSSWPPPLAIPISSKVQQACLHVGPFVVEGPGLELGAALAVDDVALEEVPVVVGDRPGGPHAGHLQVGAAVPEAAVVLAAAATDSAVAEHVDDVLARERATF